MYFCILLYNFRRAGPRRRKSPILRLAHRRMAPLQDPGARRRGARSGPGGGRRAGSAPRDRERPRLGDGALSEGHARPRRAPRPAAPLT